MKLIKGAVFFALLLGVAHSVLADYDDEDYGHERHYRRHYVTYGYNENGDYVRYDVYRYSGRDYDRDYRDYRYYRNSDENYQSWRSPARYRAVSE